MGDLFKLHWASRDMQIGHFTKKLEDYDHYAYDKWYSKSLTMTTVEMWA